MLIPSRRAMRQTMLMAALAMAAAGAMAQSPADKPQSVTVVGQKNASIWFRAESEHFVVFSDTTHDDVYQMLNNLEKLDHLLRIYTRNYNTSQGPVQKISLYYHNRLASFNAVASGRPNEAIGLYNSCGAGVQGFGVHLEKVAALTNEKMAKSPLNDTLSFLFEAYTRHFIYRYTDIRSPLSYIDGFAQYFSSVRFTDDQMSIGRAPNGQWRYVSFLDEGRRYALNFKDVIEPTGSKDVGVNGKSAVRLEFLTKSWLLTHYMLSTPENREMLDKYLDLVHHDVPSGTAFSQAYGIKADDVDAMMWRYRLKGVEVKQVILPSLPTAHVEFTMLPEASTGFILSDAALKACPLPKEGQGLLRELTAQAAAVPMNELGKMTLSRAQVEWGKPQDALAYLTEKTRKDPTSFDAAYLLGLANLRIAQQSDKASRTAYLQAAKASLARARKLNGKSAQAAFAAYQTELQAGGQPSAAAINDAIAAWDNAHEVNQFARSAALAYAYAGRGAEADNALAVMAHNERDPEMATWARTWQAKLSTGVRREELVAEMRLQPAAPAAFKEWTQDTDNIMDAVRFNAGIEDARGYLDSLRLANPSTPGAMGQSTQATELFAR